MEFWSSLLLLFNLFATYLPVYRLIQNLKDLNEVSKMKRGVNPNDPSQKNVADRILDSNTPLLALMIGICILIVVPNGIELWEHIVVLFVALLILVYINRKSLRKKDEMDSYEIEDEDFNNIDTESFKKMMADMVEKKKEEERDKTVVSINTGDMK